MQEFLKLRPRYQIDGVAVGGGPSRAARAWFCEAFAVTVFAALMFFALLLF
jgi:hypothetical protein